MNHPQEKGLGYLRTEMMASRQPEPDLAKDMKQLIIQTKMMLKSGYQGICRVYLKGDFLKNYVCLHTRIHTDTHRCTRTD